jgi:hypothetical protein
LLLFYKIVAKLLLAKSLGRKRYRRKATKQQEFSLKVFCFYKLLFLLFIAKLITTLRGNTFMKKSCCFVANRVQSLGRVRKYQQQFSNMSNKKTIKATRILRKKDYSKPLSNDIIKKNMNGQ